jgi:5-methylcytosine-specific restriction endonuclease McrA
VKALDAFHRNKLMADARRSECKACRVREPKQRAPRPDRKTCKGCQETKPLTDFYPQGKTFDSRCKPCRLAVEREKRSADPEKYRAWSRYWWRRNLDKAREIQRASYRQNRDYYAAKNAEWIRNNPEANRARRARYRARKAAAPGAGVTVAEWRALVEAYGGYCLCCLRNDLPLEADHVIPLALGGYHQIDNIQPLCRSCNASKADRVGQLDYRVYFDLAV